MAGSWRMAPLLIGKSKYGGDFSLIFRANASDNQTVITEAFTFDDGETEQRIWTLSRLADNKIEAYTEDVAGKATGIINGATLNMRYDFS